MKKRFNVITPKVSVIVAVYKAENYIHRCLDSLLAQTMPDFELLLIDDGSPDRSGAICDEYAQKDSRIRVLHKENGGVASARQMGIEQARGEYSIQIDPDDWVEADMLYMMYSNAVLCNADILFCDICEHYGDNTTIKCQKVDNASGEIILKNYLDGNVFLSMVNCLIRHSMYEKYNNNFVLSMNYMEDAFVICKFLMHNPKLGYINKTFYHYDKKSNENSLSRYYSKRTIASISYFINYFEKVLDKDFYQNSLFRRKINCKEMMFNSYLYSSKEIKEMFSETNDEFILRYKKGEYPNDRCLYLTINGYGFIAKLLHKLKKKIVSINLSCYVF